MKVNKPSRILYFVFFIILAIIACNKRPPGPKLISLSPEKGSVGTRVTIQGENLFYFDEIIFNEIALVEEPTFLNNGMGMEFNIPIDVPLGLAEVYLSFEDGRSNSLTFEVIDATTVGGIPVINMLTPSTALVGCELKIEGENLESVTKVIFPLGLQAEILSQSASQLIVLVPESATNGLMELYTDTDTISQEVFLEFGEVLIINQILPAGNDQGGPVLVYGENLNLVSQIFFGNVEQPVFIQTPNLLRFHVPISDEIKGQTVSFRLKTDQGCYSQAIDYQVGNDISAQSPLTANSVNVIIPNVPGGASLPSINNAWKVVSNFWTDDPVLEFFFLGSAISSGTDTITLEGYGDTLAVYVENGSFLQINYGGQLYFGALDSTYPDFDPSPSSVITPIRFVLTPIDFGDQIELIKPFVIEVGESSKDGNDFIIKGRYFSQSDNIIVKIFDFNSNEITPLTNNSVDFIDNTTIKFELQDNLPLGDYHLILKDGNEFEVEFSNIFPFSI